MKEEFDDAMARIEREEIENLIYEGICPENIVIAGMSQRRRCHHLDGFVLQIQTGRIYSNDHICRMATCGLGCPRGHGETKEQV